MMKKISLFAVASLLLAGLWRDTDGNLVSAHAGCVTVDKDTGKFWLFGEYKVEGHTEGGGVSVYSSSDLATWESHGLALAPVPGHGYISPENIIQRPKVVYSKISNEYRMWWHADNTTYGLLLQGFAPSPNISGSYTFVSATAPLGNWSQDFGMFTDYKDGRSYALYSNGDGRDGRDAYLTAYDDTSALESIVHRFGKYDLEAPAIVQTDSSYYALMSHKTGYRPNNVVAFRADSPGPWPQPFTVAPPNTRTFSSQSGSVLRIAGSRATTNLYLGDQWDASSLWESRLQLQWHDVYDLDVQTGEWAAMAGTERRAADARKTTSGGAGGGGEAAAGIRGNDSTVTFQGVRGAGQKKGPQPQSVSDAPGGAPDRIGGAWQLRRIASVVRDTHKGVVLSAPLLLALDEGDANTITVGGLYNGFDYKGADLEKIVVYPPETGICKGRRCWTVIG
ncbi:glycoside hydrolase family 43 protein [Lasiosphaeria miniovina]|uniref:Glycoside hydrolase family 43 protein n=1 Tax=Lasiosphaeria miniovina TaxID=1954250 RepID=A0AA40A571_9PEZI|nr:glycoside hydrolase family 43 protein [Lasiosphaeria miniovina]KAK0709395.1 glycoside hydrolase family 43 protein [Lasiosphaeria miniovina]